MRFLKIAVGLAATAACSATAHAGISYPQDIGGSFVGILTGGYGELASDAGHTVTGRFGFSDMGCRTYPYGPDGHTCLPVNGGISVSVAGYQLGFGGDFPFNAISVTNSLGLQELDLFANYTNPYDNAELSLVGAANAFVDGTNYATLQPGVATSGGLFFMGGRELGGEVHLTSISIDGVAVPEPATWPMLAVALGGLGWVLRVRLGRRGAQASTA